MAKSNARKKREKRMREGKRNPEKSRGSWNGVTPITKRTPTLIEKQERQQKKHKKRHSRDEFYPGDAFLMFFPPPRASAL